MEDLWAATCLFLVLEGILPFLAPAKWREVFMQLANLSDRQIRAIGGFSMIAGLLLLQLVR